MSNFLWAIITSLEPHSAFLSSSGLKSRWLKKEVREEVRLYGSEADRRHGFVREEHRIFLVAPSLEQGIPEVFRYFREIF